MIFVKNPVPGNVKTRLAKDIGDEAATSVYEKLLEITRDASLGLSADRWLWYGDFVNHKDTWDEEHFEKKMQSGETLGDRMGHAFQTAFEAGFEKVVIIGSDCPEMNTDILQKAYEHLDQSEVVLGPASDGGYYLLGMRKFVPVFEEKAWSTANVLASTIADLKKMGIRYELMDELSDIDTIIDLKKFPDIWYTK